MSDFDLSDFDTSAVSGHTFHPRNPQTLAPLAMSITLAGPGSDAYEAAREARDGKFKLLLQRYKTSDRIPTDQLQEVATAFLTAVTLGWDNVVRDKKPVPFNKDECRKLYGSSGFSWLRDQVDAELADVGNFLPKKKGG